MYEFALPIIYALLLWWFSTGVLLYLNQLPPHTFRWSMLGMTAVALAALYGHVVTSTSPGVGSAYLSFTCGLLVWGWVEMSYYTGFVTGVRSEPCPPDASAWRRFGLAIETSLFHELTIVGLAALLAMLAWEADNQVGTWTFVVLWAMRWSAKLNLFFGVPNLNEEWLPESLRYLASYMAKRPMNLLFPVSVTGATVILTLLVQSAATPETGGFRSVGLMLVSSLLALAILEHWFLVLPISETALWRWATQKQATDSDAPGPIQGPGTVLGKEDRADSREAELGGTLWPDGRVRPSRRGARAAAPRDRASAGCREAVDNL